MPFDPKGVATQILNEELGGADEHQGKNTGSPEYENRSGLEEAWKDLIEAIHAKDHVGAAGIHRNIFQILESEPHEEAGEEEGYAYGGVTMPKRSVDYEGGSATLGQGPLKTFKNPFGSRFPSSEHGADPARPYLKARR